MKNKALRFEIIPNSREPKFNSRELATLSSFSTSYGQGGVARAAALPTHGRPMGNRRFRADPLRIN